MPDALSTAKAALASSNKKFPGAMAASAGVKPAGARVAPVKAATSTTPPASARENTRQQNIQAVRDVARNAGMTGVGTLGTLHEGGVVPKTGPYQLEEGETVIPADKTDKALTGRQSEYRKVYIARRQARSGGGNKPVTETAEKHDQKKAEAGIKEKKA